MIDPAKTNVNDSDQRLAIIGVMSGTLMAYEGIICEINDAVKANDMKAIKEILACFAFISIATKEMIKDKFPEFIAEAQAAVAEAN